VKDKGLETWKKIIEDNGEIKTGIVQTGSGGYHYYFKYDEEIKTTTKIRYNGEKVGIDVRNDKSYVIAPPSIHENGKEYKWIKEKEEIRKIPKWLKEIINEGMKKEIKKEEKKGKKETRKEEDTRKEKKKDEKIENIGKENIKETHIIKLLGILKKERVDDYETWMKIGMIIKNERPESYLKHD